MPIPVVAAAASAGFSYFADKTKARIEAHIQDRIPEYSTFTDSKLNDIIRIYGGEMGEAAKRVLSSRPAQSILPPPSVAIAPTQVVPAPIAQSSSATQAPGTPTALAGFFGGGNGPVLLIGAGLLFFLLLRRR